MIKVELLPGEEICPRCDGIGEIHVETRMSIWRRPCDRCWGAGKLDWIEMAMGKESPNSESSSSSSSSISASSSTRKEIKNDTKWLHSRRIRNIGNYFRQLHVREKGALERQLLKARSW